MPKIDIDLEFRRLLHQYDKNQDKEEVCEVWIDFFFHIKSVVTPAMLEATKGYIAELMQDNSKTPLPIEPEALIKSMLTEKKFIYLGYLSLLHEENLSQIIRKILKDNTLNKNELLQSLTEFLFYKELDVCSGMLDILKHYIEELIHEIYSPALRLNSLQLIDKMFQEKNLEPLYILLCLHINQPFDKEILTSSFKLLFHELFYTTQQHALIQFLFLLTLQFISGPKSQNLSKLLHQVFEEIDEELNKLDTHHRARLLSPERIKQLTTPFPPIPPIHDPLFHAISQLCSSMRTPSQRILLEKLGYILLKQAILSRDVATTSRYCTAWVHSFTTEVHLDLVRLTVRELSSRPSDSIVQIHTSLFLAQIKGAIKFSNSELVMSLLTYIDTTRRLESMLQTLFKTLCDEEMDELSQLILDQIEIHQKHKQTLVSHRLTHRLAPIQNSGRNKLGQKSLETKREAIARNIERLQYAAAILGIRMKSLSILEALPEKALCDMLRRYIPYLQRADTDAFQACYAFSAIVFFSLTRKQRPHLTYEEISLFPVNILSSTAYFAQLKYQLREQLHIPFIAENINEFFDLFCLKNIMYAITVRDPHAITALFTGIPDRLEITTLIEQICESLSLEQWPPFRDLLIQAFEKNLFTRLAKTESTVQRSIFVLSKFATIMKDPSLMSILPHDLCLKKLNAHSIILQSSKPQPTERASFDLQFLAMYCLSYEQRDATVLTELHHLIQPHIYPSVKGYLIHLKENLVNLVQTPFIPGCRKALEAWIHLSHVPIVCEPAPRLFSRSHGRFFEPAQRQQRTIGTNGQRHLRLP